MQLEKSRVAVVGPTGVVGRALLEALAERGVPSERVTALGTERSEAEEVSYGDDTLEVERAGPDAFRGMNVAFLAAPQDVARQLAPQAQAAGAWVVDVSPAFRLDAAVPLVLPALSEAPLKAPFRGRVVACPSPITTALALALTPLHEAFVLEHVHVTALMGASSAGESGIRELEMQTANLLSGREVEPQRFPHRLAFNVVPQVGPVEPGSGFTAEELGWAEELARLTPTWPERPVVFGTALQVPTFFGHMLVLDVKLASHASAAAVRDALKAGKKLKVLDSPEERIYPMPMLVTQDDSVHVGRVRTLPALPGWVSLIVAVDNVGRGAALNALEAAELLLARP
ncbi:MAG: aspartate-semialdehyde dehydrogenase [Myxococcaceae bacterium]|nr:aspartate-semialdehyde dehydrogenase [Myxococcaceae bacterium]